VDEHETDGVREEWLGIDRHIVVIMLRSSRGWERARNERSAHDYVVIGASAG
jgi:hypothetical protein